MKKKICLHCRTPLEKWRSKYCQRCYPHVKRMQGKARSATKKWKPVSKFCKSCGRIRLIVDFPLVRKKSCNGIEYDFIRPWCVGCREYNKSYYKQVRRTREKELPATLTKDEWQETLRACDYRCIYCGKPWEHQDHFVPLSKGGGFTLNNVVPACDACNVQKGTHDPFDFINRKMVTYTLKWISDNVV